MTNNLQYGLTFEQYNEVKAIHATTLKNVATSPSLALWRKEHGFSSPSLDIGSAVHGAILEPEIYHNHFVDYQGDRRKKEYKEFKALHIGKTILSNTDADKIKYMHDSVMNHPDAGELFESDGNSEVSIFWDHARTGKKIAVRIDRLVSILPYWIELKTARNVSPGLFFNDCARLHYDIQIALYNDGLISCGINKTPLIVAVQNTAPYDCVVFEVPKTVLMIGLEKYEKAIDTLLECKKTGTWPSCTNNERVQFAVPNWAIPQDEEIELTFNGEVM